jgi:hypothetical protein
MLEAPCQRGSAASSSNVTEDFGLFKKAGVDEVQSLKFVTIGLTELHIAHEGTGSFFVFGLWLSTTEPSTCRKVASSEPMQA